jgi:hypothetical protein
MGMSEYRDKADTSRCYFCPKRNDIEVHHIVPQRFNGSDERENLVALCDRCHEKLESLYDKRFYEKLGVTDETGERSTHFECELGDCGSRADVKIGSQFGISWFCLSCGTDRYEAWKYATVQEDHTGRMGTRVEWIDAIEADPFTVIYQ